jgi:hypothetical protein
LVAELTVADSTAVDITSTRFPECFSLTLSIITREVNNINAIEKCGTTVAQRKTEAGSDK